MVEVGDEGRKWQEEEFCAKKTVMEKGKRGEKKKKTGRGGRWLLVDSVFQCFAYWLMFFFFFFFFFF